MNILIWAGASFVCTVLIGYLLKEYQATIYKSISGLIFLQAAFFIILIIIVILAKKKYIKPLENAENMLNESYEEITKNNSAVTMMPMIDKIVGIVISHQRDSWHRELTSNILGQEAKLAELQSQINPHFLYNTLESIRGFALLKDVPEIAEMIEALALLFRSNTRKTGTMVTLEDEIGSVENYVLIQRFRFRDKFSFEKKIEEDQEILKCKIPNFLLQPIVENAIYHGLETKAEKGRIILQAYKTQSQLVIQIYDDGCGIPDNKLKELNHAMHLSGDFLQTESKNETHTGIGLVNINQRIKMQFGDKYGITVASTLKIGTQVEISLPYVL